MSTEHFYRTDDLLALNLITKIMKKLLGKVLGEKIYEK